MTSSELAVFAGILIVLGWLMVGRSVLFTVMLLGSGAWLILIATAPTSEAAPDRCWRSPACRPAVSS